MCFCFAKCHYLPPKDVPSYPPPPERQVRAGPSFCAILSHMFPCKMDLRVCVCTCVCVCGLGPTGTEHLPSRPTPPQEKGKNSSGRQAQVCFARARARAIRATVGPRRHLAVRPARLKRHRAGRTSFSVRLAAVRYAGLGSSNAPGSLFFPPLVLCSLQRRHNCL